jgi:YVTN family beta-propeller protein
MKLEHSLSVPCPGVDHMDFTADGTRALASCEFGSSMILLDIPHRRVLATVPLDGGAGKPQDVKLSPDGRVFYVADMNRGGVYRISATGRPRVLGFVATGTGAHGLYPSRDARTLYVTNRGNGTITLLDFATGRPKGVWKLPAGASPDMGNVTDDGRTLWLSGRYSGVVYAIDTRTGRVRRSIPVGLGPHGLCVWPQPGRYSLGHTGEMR